MKRRRILILVLVLLVLAGTGYGALRGLGVFDAPTAYRAVQPGHQEIVFLAPATSADSWERLVAPVDALVQESQQAASTKQNLVLDKNRACINMTSNMPEVALCVEG